MTDPIVTQADIERAALAMQNAVIRDDEGEFPRLFDMLGFSGENKAHTVVRGLARAALASLPAQPEPAKPADSGEVAEAWQAERQKVLDDIGVVMSEFVDNWPPHKNLDTSIALIAKTIRASRDEVSRLEAERRELVHELLVAAITNMGTALANHTGGEPHG